MDNQFNILVVDDSQHTQQIIKRNLELQGHKVLVADHGKQGLKLIAHHDFDLILTDLKMPIFDGCSLVREIRKAGINTPIIVITGYPSLDSAVTMLKKGVSDYLIKPFTDEELLVSVNNVMEGFKEKHTSCSDDLSTHGIIGESKSLKKVLKMMNRCAENDLPVMIVGESGTGKELVARGIHRMSSRQEGPFVALNCATIPEGLLESELFGYEKGAFTGADTNRDGLFQLAQKGTLFLDEIGDAPLSLQAKLLRVLEEKEFSRLGSSRIETADTRILAATHQNLDQLVKTGLFRQDLLYRLNVIEIELPALHERKEDIPLLLTHFLEKHGKKLGKQNPMFSDELVQSLKTLRWPGNIRELENLCQRLIVMSDSELIGIENLPQPYKQNTKTKSIDAVSLEEMEKKHIKSTLETCENNRSKAAIKLGVTRKTLLSKIQKYGL
jgi:DNA-binding NtrC family response regulator